MGEMARWGGGCSSYVASIEKSKKREREKKQNKHRWVM